MDGILMDIYIYNGNDITNLFIYDMGLSENGLEASARVMGFNWGHHRIW